MLLTLLGTVNRAIEEAEDPRPKPTKAPRRWCIMWRWGLVEQPRVGVLHTAECFLATDEPIDTQTVQVERRREGRRVELCETCRPQLP